MSVLFALLGLRSTASCAEGRCISDYASLLQVEGWAESVQLDVAADGKGHKCYNHHGEGPITYKLTVQPRGQATQTLAADKVAWFSDETGITNEIKDIQGWLIKIIKMGPIAKIHGDTFCEDNPDVIQAWIDRDYTAEKKKAPTKDKTKCTELQGWVKAVIRDLVVKLFDLLHPILLKEAGATEIYRLDDANWREKNQIPSMLPQTVHRDSSQNPAGEVHDDYCLGSDSRSKYLLIMDKGYHIMNLWIPLNDVMTAPLTFEFGDTMVMTEMNGMDRVIFSSLELPHAGSAVENAPDDDDIEEVSQVGVAAKKQTTRYSVDYRMAVKTGSAPDLKQYCASPFVFNCCDQILCENPKTNRKYCGVVDKTETSVCLQRVPRHAMQHQHHQSEHNHHARQHKHDRKQRK